MGTKDEDEYEYESEVENNYESTGSLPFLDDPVQQSG